MGEREALGVPDSAGRVTVCGVELAVSREGRGPPIVCLHAIAHGGRDYEELARALSDRFEIIRIDWPGHGRSLSDCEPPSAARYGELLVALLDELAVTRPILVGNSVGGSAALHYARVRPVRALVLCNPGGLMAVTYAVRLACRAFAALFDRGVRGAHWFARVYALYYRYLVLPSRAAHAQRERIIAAGYELSPLLAGAWRSFARPEADLRAHALSVRAPVWVAWAKRDRVISLARSKACIDRMQHATISYFDAGHSAFLECPAQFVREFLQFVASLPSERAAATALAEQTDGVSHASYEP